MVWNNFWPSGEIPTLKAVINFFFFSMEARSLSWSLCVLRACISPGDSFPSSSTFISAQFVKFKMDTLWWPNLLPADSKNNQFLILFRPWKSMKRQLTDNDDFKVWVKGRHFSLGDSSVDKFGWNFWADWIANIFQCKSRHSVGQWLIWRRRISDWRHFSVDIFRRSSITSTIEKIQVLTF